MLKFFRIYGLSCVVALLIFYLSITTSAPKPYLEADIPSKDKIVHFFLYMLLAMAICRDLFRQSVAFSSRKMYLWAIVLPILYGGLIELLQGITHEIFGRAAEWGDWFANILGVLTGYLLSRIIFPKIITPEKTLK